MRPLCCLLALVALAAAAPPAARAAVPADTVKAREHFFGAQNVDAQGRVRSDKVILSWFSVGSLALAIDGRVVLLDTYIHKGEDRPGYVPTTTAELVALRPESIFIGHGHFDHAANAGLIAQRTGATIVGTPEHCDQARDEVDAFVPCTDAASRGAPPGAVRELAPLGAGVRVTALKHVHSAAEPPDGGQHESSLASPGLVDANPILLHPPGPSLLPGLNPSGDEGGTMLYRFAVGRFSLAWHDSSGPLRERAPGLFAALRALGPVDVEAGATLGFNDPTNGMRDPVDYAVALRPRLFVPIHHDFIAEYGASKGVEGTFRRELARRGPGPTTVRWINDPVDYLRPELLTFDVGTRSEGRRCLARRSPLGRRGIGRVRLGMRRTALARLPGAVRRGARSYTLCVTGGRGSVRAVLSPAGRVRLVTSTAPGHGSRGVRPGARTGRLRRAYPGAERVSAGVVRAGRGSPAVIGTRKARVRYVGVADRGLRRSRGALARYLRAASR